MPKLLKTRTANKAELQRIINELDRIPHCNENAQRFCDGSWRDKLEMMTTCTRCWLVADLRELKRNL